ncbi:unnamed protein product, partial [Ectocarpus sp. 4 AP-2014]
MVGTVVQRVFWCTMLLTTISATHAQTDADYELVCENDSNLDRGDGLCDDYLNEPLCRYDGGDCCSCTCDRSLLDSTTDDSGYDVHPCGDNLFNCIDPSAPDFDRLPVYGCGSMPSVPPRCPPEGQSQWVVEDTAGASALANAVSNCSGGNFDVDWRGHVFVNTTLWVVDGTSVTVSGAGQDAVVDGGGHTRPFVVVNASLRLDGLAVENGAADFGGGIFAGGSSLTLNSTRLSNNTALIGGTAYIDAESTVSCIGANEISHSTALNGGSLFIDGGSSVSWEAFSFLENQAAAVLIRGASTLYWSGDTTFIANGVLASAVTQYRAHTLDILGGSNVSWDGKTTFADGYQGTAVLVQDSNLSWSGETLFTNNTESGCIDVRNSHVSWSGVTSFENNHGGTSSSVRSVISISSAGSVSFSGRTQFVNNTASHTGGAVRVGYGTALEWSGPTIFHNNTASTNGGALYVTDGNVSWSGQTSFDGNSAIEDGGALFIDTGATVTWSGETTFAGNMATVNGGAIGTALEPVVDGSLASLVVNGSTNFVDNTCEGSGGAIKTSGAVSLALEDVVFAGNSAQSRGGALYISNTAFGPTLVGLTFTGNTAHTGGAVYVTASGVAVLGDMYPTTFAGCYFADNIADLSGGAIDSSSGDDSIESSDFISNKAVIGGALRLAGNDVSINYCTFDGNAAGTLDGGPAISNVGDLYVWNSVFRRNYIECPPGSFVDFYESEGGRYEAVCDGCPAADDGITMGVENLVPTCTETLENTRSDGANTSIEDIRIDPGYWRATTTTRTILPCYNAAACLGGITGEAGYCREGYYGPYCAICTENYGRTMAFECTKCSSGEGVAVGVIFVSTLAVAGAALVAYLVSNEREGGGGGGLIVRVKDKVSFRSLKIVVVVWQILTQA